MQQYFPLYQSLQPEAECLSRLLLWQFLWHIPVRRSMALPCGAPLRSGYHAGNGNTSDFISGKNFREFFRIIDGIQLRTSD